MEKSSVVSQPLSPAPSRPSRLPGRFARLPELAGPGFLPLGLFARLPLAMLTVGTLTLVTAVSNSYAIGGMAAGAVGIGSALGAPVLGSLADRAGQRIVLLVAAVVNTLAVAGLLAVAYLTTGYGSVGDAVGVLIAAFLAGASCPQVGPMARVRWMALTTRNLSSSAGSGGRSVAANRADLDTALSYEGTADEITFVLGPALVGVLASMVAPWLPLALAAVMTITLVPAFAVHPSQHAVVPAPRKPRAGVVTPSGQGPYSEQSSPVAPQRRSRWAGAVVAVPVVAMVCMGTFFGATQNALSAFSAQYATAEIAGLLYAVMGLSSAVAALSVAFWPQRFSLASRWVAAALAMSVLSLLLLLPAGIWPMIFVLLILGIPVGPVMVTVFSIGGVVAPAGRMATVMTALASGIVAGTALGSYLAGQLAETQGPGAAFVVSMAAAAGLLLLGVVTSLVMKRQSQS
ncbi:MFS transporter [Paenarthrobacter aurescens]|uniref:Major facilitator superfamily (MFS) transporter n=1 Tax=Paenarthrobacter aurescens (strain TC1) TaxID=290340 RepID=A1R7R5_PAEAT|nr:MFS transporter [Paenarthrobacter aurescens]ABM08035.1 putative major facilitator superfamily (MFS) transporter [Paenarthrobacter aurescens TC1]